MHCRARLIDSSEALPTRLPIRQLELHEDFPPHPTQWLVIPRPFGSSSHGPLMPSANPQEGPFMALCRRYIAPALATLVVLLSNSPLRAQEINWRHSYAEARREAEQSGRLLFLDFGTQNCI